MIREEFEKKVGTDIYKKCMSFYGSFIGNPGRQGNSERFYNLIVEICKGSSEPITPERLERHGWVWKAPYWVLKSTPRIGWNPATKEIVIGYAAIPVKVESIGHLRSILLDFNIRII